MQQVNTSIDNLWQDKKYGHTPREKPEHLIKIAMKHFISLCILLRNTKVTPINNLCQDFKVDLLCGCKMQVDWQQVPQARRFHNLFGVGMDTRSIVAHNINELNTRNQFGGCAMMAMSTLAHKVVNSGVDPTGLGQWCWMLIGLGQKKSCIVMAYQPSNSSGQTAGTMVKDQHSCYFQSIGDARLPRTIFCKQLVAQLLIWKASDNNIVLLGDFNEHVYSGCLARRLAEHELNFTKMCRQHTGIHGQHPY
jgi:hypothetical protein